MADGHLRRDAAGAARAAGSRELRHRFATAEGGERLRGDATFRRCCRIEGSLRIPRPLLTSNAIFYEDFVQLLDRSIG